MSAGWAAEVAWEPRRQSLRSETPVGALAAAGCALGVLAAASGLDLLPRAPADRAFLALLHGALAHVAVAWARPRRSLLAGPVVLLAAALALAPWGPPGAALFLLLPPLVWWITGPEGRRALGFGAPSRMAFVAWGALAGAALGAHLLLSAARTLGYPLRPTGAGIVWWLCYDIGVNAFTAELFFRGSLFRRLVSRHSLAASASASTAACLARYIADPMLPKNAELIVGALFYVGVLSIANTWLYWTSRSLYPGLACGAAFFAAYRLLQVS